MSVQCCEKEFMLNAYSPCPESQSDTGTFSGSKVFTFDLDADGYVGFSVFCSSTVTSPTLGASTGIISSLPDGRTVTNWEGVYLAPTLGQVSITVNGGVGDYEVFFWPMKRKYCLCDGSIPYKPFPANPCCEFTVDWKDGDVYWIVSFFRVLGFNTINDCAIYKSDGTLVAAFTAAQLPRRIQIIEDDTYTVQVKSNIGYDTYFCFDCAIEPDFITTPANSSTYQQVVSWQNDSDNGLLTPFAEMWDLEISATPYDISVVNPYVGYNNTFKQTCGGCTYDMTLFVCDTIGRIFGTKKTNDFTHASIDISATSYTLDPAFVAWAYAGVWTFSASGILAINAGSCVKVDTGDGNICIKPSTPTCGNVGQKWSLFLNLAGCNLGFTEVIYLKDVDSQDPTGSYTLTFYGSDPLPPLPPGSIVIT